MSLIADKENWILHAALTALGKVTFLHSARFRLLDKLWILISCN